MDATIMGATRMEVDNMHKAIYVIVSCARNIRLKRVLHAVEDDSRLNFWCLIKGNCMDVAVIEWCKLFGSHTEQILHWKNIIPNEYHDEFRRGLYSKLNINKEEYDEYWRILKEYRDKYTAHYDDEFNKSSKSQHPDLDQALLATYYYYDQLWKLLKGHDESGRYPADIEEYFDRFITQTKEVAEKAIGSTREIEENVW